MKRKLIRSLIILLVVVSVLNSRNLSLSNHSIEHPKDSQLDDSWYTYISMITFNGNTWDMGTQNVSITGNGSIYNPYILENHSFITPYTHLSYNEHYLILRILLEDNFIIIRNCNFYAGYRESTAIIAENGTSTHQLTIENCTFGDFSYYTYALNFYDVSNVVIDSCSFYRCYASAFRFCNNVDIDNTLVTSGRNGLWFFNSTDIFITSSRFQMIDYSGVYATNCTDINITDNYFVASESGIYLKTSTDCLIDQNHIEFMFQNGMEIRKCSGVELNENTVYYSVLDGMWIYDSDDIEIKFNNISKSGLYGIKVGIVKNPDIEGNIFENNEIGDIYYFGQFGVFFLNNSAGEIIVVTIGSLYLMLFFFVMYRIRKEKREKVRLGWKRKIDSLKKKFYLD